MPPLVGPFQRLNDLGWLPEERVQIQDPMRSLAKESSQVASLSTQLVKPRDLVQSKLFISQDLANMILKEKIWEARSVWERN